MYYLHKQHFFGKDKISKLDSYENCILGKQHRLKFNSSTNKAKSGFDYVHDNLGLARVQTQVGNIYFISIIDDYFRKVWIYLLKSKDDVVIRFREWKFLVENHTNKSINGHEFCNYEYDMFCKYCGI